MPRPAPPRPAPLLLCSASLAAEEQRPYSPPRDRAHRLGGYAARWVRRRRRDPQQLVLADTAVMHSGACRCPLGCLCSPRLCMLCVLCSVNRGAEASSSGHGYDGFNQEAMLQQMAMMQAATMSQHGVGSRRGEAVPGSSRRGAGHGGLRGGGCMSQQGGGQQAR
jgi:hypothetical protein